jgi:plastocyanin
MRRLLILPILVLAALLVGVSPAAAAKPRSVKVGDDFFVRKGSVPTVTVKKGKTVRWRWAGHDQHNVVVQKGPTSFQSSLKTSGTFKKTMTKKGTYTIICSIHAPDMRMKLKVK